MPANAGVEHAGTGAFQLGGEDFVFRPSGAVFHQVEQRQTENNDEIIAAGSTDAFYNVHGKALAVVEAAAVFIITLIGAGGEKLVDKIAFAAHHFHAVVTGLLRQLGAADVVGHGLLHFFGA